MESKTIQATGAKGHHTFVLTVNETYVGNGAENFSKLSFSLTCNPRSWDWYGWGNSITYSINIGGNTYTGSIPDMVANTTNTIRSESNIQIPHNTDGTKSISISFSITDTANQYYTCGNCSKSDTFDLTTILRYPQLTFDSFSNELNRIQVTVANSLGMNMDKYQCAKVSDGTVVASGDLTSTSSATFYITGLTPNTSYSGTYKVRGYSNGGWGDWITLTNANMKTTALPTVSSTANVGIEQASKIQFNNLNFVSKWSYVCKTYNDNTTVASGSNITTNNYEITLTSSQRSTLLNKYTGTTKPKVYWEITITSNGTNYRVYTTGSANPTTEYTIPDTSTYQPTFTSSYITELKNTQSTISGANKFIKNHNQLSLKITPMVGKYGTSGKTYTIVCGSKSTSVNYSSSAQTVTLNNIDGDTVSITAVDNRGKATLVSIAITLVNYSNPVITAGALTRQNGTGTYAYLNANGTYTNWSGLSSANSIQTVKYRYRQTGTSTWSSYVTISPSTNTGGNWTIANLLLSTVFTNTLSYEVELYIADKLEAITRTINLSTADVFIWRDLANKRFGIRKKPTVALDVNGDFAVSGTVSQLKRESGGSWIKGRDNAVVRQTKHATSSGSSWNPVVSVKTANGNWSIGNVGDDNLGFSYDTDTDYNNNNNASKVWNLPIPSANGTIATSADLSGKAPKSHAASGTTYGVGTASNYGHCRVINNLTTSSATNGYALQAYQGKILKDLIDGKITITKNTNDITIKFDSGLAIVVMHVKKSFNFDYNWSGWWEGSMTFGNWPITFTARPWVMVCNDSGVGALWESWKTPPTTTSAGVGYFNRPNSYNATDVEVNILAIGNWK